MASMRDIKRRKSSIQSTQQITKAMKLVSTVKLQKAREKAEQTNPYFQYMYRTVSSMLAKSGSVENPYLTKGASPRKAVVVLTSNRGLAGGYNSNAVKMVTESALFDVKETDVYTIGEKGRELLERQGYVIRGNCPQMVEAPDYAQVAALCGRILAYYAAGEIGEIYLVYTHFKNTVSHEPELLKLLPVELPGEEAPRATEPQTLMNYEPNEEEALDRIIPKYLTSLFYGALVEAAASENAARMQAMDSASDNAEDMMNELSLKYNRARQGSITQELTEIIAGASAIS